MPSVLIAGGGLSGLAAAAALAEAGFSVTVLESRGFLGGRASSYPLQDADVIDNCQHVLLRCCVNLLDFYRRLNVADRIRFHRTFHFLEPGGRESRLERGPLPAPLHFSGAFLRMACLDLPDKVSIVRGLLALRRERGRDDLDRISMLDWLHEKRQTPRAITRFWNQVLVSAINEDVDRMAASHGFQVFWLGFLSSADSYEMGVPDVPLGDLYAAGLWDRFGTVRLCPRTPVEAIETDGGRVRGVRAGGEHWTADAYIAALEPHRVNGVCPSLDLDLSWVEYSPIAGIHLWFDRPVTELPHAALLDRTIQWMFNKKDGRYLQVVVSAARSLAGMAKNDVVELALRELGEFLPAVRGARLERSHVVKEMRATFSAKPGIETLRPEPQTKLANLFLAGDWTRSGWPATMEGAVRSGYRAAEAAAAALGVPARFLLPDIA